MRRKTTVLINWDEIVSATKVANTNKTFDYEFPATLNK